MKGQLIALLILGFWFLGYTNAMAENAENLSGTKWKLIYTDPSGIKRNYDVEFKKGGIFWYSEVNDTTPDNDFWEQNGKAVKITFNDGYAIYEGSFISKDLIKGSAVNIKNIRWEFELRR
jgi:hypothetical protein